MKKSFERKIKNFVGWFQFNVIIAFLPFILIQFINCLFMFSVELKDIIPDYSGLCYSTSAILLVCAFDYLKNHNSKIAEWGMIYGIFVFVLTTCIYGTVNLRNKFAVGEYTDKSVKKIIIILTVIMVLNILAIITVKVNEYFFEDKK